MDPEPGPARSQAFGVVVLVLLLAGLLLLEFSSCLSMSFSGDDFELLTLARVGGFSPTALFVPHRGVFLKPVMNTMWAVLARLFGANPAPWYAFGMAIHLLNAVLFGLFAGRLSAAWTLADRGGAPRVSDPHAYFGLAAAAVWAGHDRLAEPLFSLSSLNHSVTFALYLVALHALLRALTSRASRDRFLAMLLLLPPLFSYEIAASLIPVAAILLFFDWRWALRDGVRAFSPGLAGVAIAYAAIQAVVRATSGAGSYYRLSPALALRNVSEAGLAFLHIKSDWITPGPLPALAMAAALAAGLILARDAIIRFGLAWALAALLPIAPIPELSDRYHYIVFAGLTLAACRSSALSWARLAHKPDRFSHARLAAGTAIWGLLLAVHLLWSFGGIREQATFYRYKAMLPAALLDGARAKLAQSQADDRAAGGATGKEGGGPFDGSGESTIKGAIPEESRDAADGGAGSGANKPSGGLAGGAAVAPAAARPSVLVLVWPDDPGFGARRIAAYESQPGNFRFGERLHPVYVRPEAVMGAVFAGDLFHVAGTDRGAFFRSPEPAVVARAILDGRVRLVSFLPAASAGDDGRSLTPAILSALRDATLTRHEIPLTLPFPGDPSRPALRFAYLEQTDRAGAFEAEYRPPVR